jgi:hypothetical protein
MAAYAATLITFITVASLQSFDKFFLATFWAFRELASHSGNPGLYTGKIMRNFLCANCSQYQALLQLTWCFSASSSHEFTCHIKYVVMSWDQNAGRSHSMKIDNSSIETVEEFKYLGTLAKQNSIQEEIKIRLKLGSACNYSVQNLLSSRLLSKNLKIKIYRTII